MASIKIGLEIHGYLQVESKRKLFCDCLIAQAETEPNTTICPICTAMPGSKPMAPNSEALEKTLAIASMLSCTINKRLLFQRKHYSWPDLPAGYQRTMSGSYALPVGEKGTFLGIRIADVHLEEDPARWQPESGCIDYNRSGFPLVEIVTEPDFRSAEEVREWLKKMVTTLSYIKAIDARAGIKSDVNVSIGPDFDRVEIKNVNSFKSIIQAIEYEVRRQGKEIKEGRKVERETRAWDDENARTVFMRKKEQAMDYMYIPEPDLPAIPIQEKLIERIAATLPEKPSEKIERYTKEWNVEASDAQVLSSDILLAELFEKVAKEISPVLAARWLRGELLRVLNYAKKDIEELEADERHLISLLKLVENKKITDETAKKLMEQLIEKPFDVEKHVQNENLEAVEDSRLLEQYCKEAIAENPKAVEDYRKGNEKALNFVVGAVMKKSKGKATPLQVNTILKRLLPS